MLILYLTYIQIWKCMNEMCIMIYLAFYIYIILLFNDLMKVITHKSCFSVMSLFQINY